MTVRRYPPRAPARNGSTRAWRKTRAEVLARDAYVCQECGNRATHADHVNARTLGGSDDPSNLQALCGPCNLSKGAT